MYKKVSANLNFVDREKAVEEFWKENKIFEKTCEKKGPSYVFYDDPAPEMFEAIKEFAIDDVKVALDTDDKRIRDEALRYCFSFFMNF